MAEGFRSMEMSEYDLYTAGDEDLRSSLSDWKHLNLIMDRPSLLLEEDLYTAGNERPKPSAPLDIGKLMIKVDWTEAFPDRWRARLQIALQTWLSKLEENATVHTIKLMDDPSFAEVQITPSTALEALKKLKFIPLRFKNENREVTAWICPDGATYVNVPQKSLLEGNRATILEDIYTAGDKKPPASLDFGRFKIKVDWAEAFPDRWRARLQIALQIWLSKLEEAPVIHSVKLMEDLTCAEVQITPATSLEVLKNHTATPLKFKYYEKGKQKKVTARIYLDEPHAFLPEKIRAQSQQDSPGGAEGQSSTPSLSDMKNLNQMHQTHNLDLTALKQHLPVQQTMQSSQNGHDQDADEPSETQDIGTFQIKVDWTGPFPDRWRVKLQKALQAWLSGLDSTFIVQTAELMDDQSCAEVQITPSSALRVLQNHTKASLKIKNIKDGKDKNDKEVTAQICLDYTKSKPVPQKSMAKNRASSLKVNSSTSKTSADTTNNVENDAPSDKSPFILPLHLSWYIYNAYKNELETIGKRHGVFFSAKVLISVKPTKNPRPDSVSKATDEFKELVIRCLDGFSHATVHHNDMDSEIVKNAIDSIKSQKTKLMFTLTDSDGVFFGRKKFTDMIEEETRRGERQSKNRSIPMNMDSNASQQCRSLDTKDLPIHLKMDEVHWDLMKLSYKEKLSELEDKYGVSFTADLHQGNVVKVQARSKGVQHVNLEGHAVRALTHLYQKLASAAVSCELRKPADQTDVRSVMEKLQQRYCVVAAERLSRWTLTGLPEHLGPAIAETEKILQRKVFDDKMKTSIGYSEDIPYARRIKLSQMPDYGAGAAGGADLDERHKFSCL